MTQSCVTVAAPSRQDPALVAAGSWTGEVAVYRTDRPPGEAELMTSVTSDHPSPVAALLWVSRSGLVCVHTSGLIRLFTADTRKNQLVVKKVDIRYQSQYQDIMVLEILAIYKFRRTW